MMKFLLSSVGLLSMWFGSLAIEANAQTFSSIRHHLAGSFMGNDPYGDDFPVGSDTITSRRFEQFRGDLNLGTGGADTDCSLDSNLDPTGGWFWAYGYSAAGLYVQGSANADSNTNFQTVFRLTGAGRISLTGTIGVSQFLGTNFSYDRPGKAQAYIRLRNLDTNQNVINKVINMNGYIADPAGIIQVSLDDEFSDVSLAAGRYRLTIATSAEDAAVSEEVGGSLAVGFVEVEGIISQD